MTVKKILILESFIIPLTIVAQILRIFLFRFWFDYWRVIFNLFILSLLFNLWRFYFFILKFSFLNSHSIIDDTHDLRPDIFEICFNCFKTHLFADLGNQFDCCESNLTIFIFSLLNCKLNDALKKLSHTKYFDQNSE